MLTLGIFCSRLSTSLSISSALFSRIPSVFHKEVLKMNKMSAPMERIQALDAIEKDIITCLQAAGQAFSELSKENKSSVKQAETQTHQFFKTLNSVESKLTEQINYLTQVSTGQPHEGSGYASQKVLQMAWHRLEHVRSRVAELDRISRINKERMTQSQERLNQGQERMSQSQPPPPKQ